MAKRLLEQSKYGNSEYFHRFTGEYSILCNISGWSLIVSGVTTALTSEYQMKLIKVTKLVDIVTSAVAVFETSVSKSLDNGEIDEREFQVLQELHLKVINELVNVDRKMESENRNQSQKSLLEEMSEIKRTLRKRGT